MITVDGGYGFNLKFLTRFWKLHKLFYSTRWSIFVFFLFIAISSLNTVIGYRVGLISGSITCGNIYHAFSRQFLQGLSRQGRGWVHVDSPNQHWAYLGHHDHKVNIKQKMEPQYFQGNQGLSCPKTARPMAKVGHWPPPATLPEVHQLLPGAAWLPWQWHPPSQLSNGPSDLDNPDQRLTADVSSMVTAYGDLVVADLFTLPPAIVYYAYKVSIV